MRLVSAGEIREMDSLTIKSLGIPGTVLMENAARGAVRAFLDHFNPPPGSQVLILCGRGNNGGDGYVMARYLHGKGMKVSVFLMGTMNTVSGDALVNLRILKGMGTEVKEIDDDEKCAIVRDEIKKSAYIIDGLLGTGLNSDVRGRFGQVIDDINSSGRPVLAIDIPSGLNADTGQIMGRAVKADITVTFGYAKPGLMVYPGAGISGRIIITDIGIPCEISCSIKKRYNLIEPCDFIGKLCSEGEDVHKGTRGHVCIIAGSSGKTGAAALTAMGAMRTGAGLVTVGVPVSLNHILEQKLTEAMTAALPETPEQSLSTDALDDILMLLKGKAVLALGPGLSTYPDTVKLVIEILKKNSLPAVLDADALSALSLVPESLEYMNKKTILTPHPGEMARLTGLTVKEIQDNRVEIARQYSEKWGCIIVLKGARTIVAEPGGMIHINITGNPALACGGSGDVLTGIISGLLARGLSPLEAAAGGVCIHGMAADSLARKSGNSGILAGEVADAVPCQMDMLLKDNCLSGQGCFTREIIQPL